MNELKTERSNEILTTQQLERAKRTLGILSTRVLKQQNVLYGNTTGVSRKNRSEGFIPAYYDAISDVSIESRFADGRPAPVHVLDGLPEEWVAQRDQSGRVTKTRPGIVAGFLRNGRFYTREQAVYALSH